MAIKITIPRLGWSMEEGTFGEWLKADGDFVNAGDPIYTLESEKALQEIESIDSGILRLLPGGPKPGEVLRVGMLIAYLVEEGEAAPVAPEGDTAQEAEPAASTEPRQRSAPPAARVENPSVSLNISEDVSRIRHPAISPRAARVAAELGVEWTNLAGSGRTGRIREQDVRAAATQGRAIDGMRRVIAERMMRSAHNTAPVTLTTRADVTDLIRFRGQLKASHADIVPAIHDYVAWAAAQALKKYRYMNRQLIAGRFVEPDGIHIGIAVNADAGLIVPVVRYVDQLGLTEIAKCSAGLIARAREQRCTTDELRGGTFTITNLGAFGIDAFTPILNSPETAILGVGAVRREAAVLENAQIAARDRLTFSLTFDHRVVDGAPAAQFLQALVAAVEHPPAPT